MKLTIHQIPPSLNKLLKMHYHEQTRLKREWQMLVLAAAKGKKPRYKKSRVTLIFFFPDHIRRDPDNYIGGSKPLIDALTMAGLIEDDSFSHITLTAERGGVDKKNPRTEIIIEEV